MKYLNDCDYDKGDLKSIMVMVDCDERDLKSISIVMLVNIKIAKGDLKSMIVLVTMMKETLTVSAL